MKNQPHIPNNLLPYEREMQERLVKPILEPLLEKISELENKLKDKSKTPSGYLCTKDAAEFLGVSTRTIHRLCEDKKLKKYYFCNKPSFKIDELENAYN